jgi:hypothetical protein
MTKLNPLPVALEAGSATNGWDAVFALNRTEVNSLFFQQYLQAGPTNPLAGEQLRVVFNLGEGSTFWILDVVLGPPEWSFHTGNVEAELELEMIKGSLISFDANTRTIQHVAEIRPNESKLSGALELAKVTGEVSKGGIVVADLGASAYRPVILGVDPDSILSTEIGNAVTSFFRHNETKFTIGAVTPGSVPSLMPTDFHFTIQQDPNSHESCVLLLIKTSGTAGSSGPLATYPIPEKRSAALLLSEHALFAGALADSLNAAFQKFGVHFSGANENGRWITASSGGGISVGKINERNEKWPSSVAWSSDAHTNESPVTVTLNGFSLTSSGGKIVANWSCKQPQYWSVYNCNVPIGGMPQVCGANAFQTAIKVDYVQTFDVAMSAGNDSIVTFKGATPTLTAVFTDLPNGWSRFWLGDHVPTAIADDIQTTLTDVLKNFTLANISTFALTSLLFPNQHAVHLQDVAAPAGLTLTGRLSQPIAITPVRTTLTPGKDIQFSVAGRPASDFLWQIKPHIGVINGGHYTAPDSIDSAQVVVVTAVSTSDPSQVGSAMVLVYQSPAATGIAVAPSNSLVTPGHQVQLSTTDANNKPVSVDWTLSPNIGHIDVGFGQGLYSYTAPANISAATEVTASAVNPANREQVGKAVIQVAPSTHISVTPGQSSLKYGASVELTSSINADDSDSLCWVVYPVGSGKVERKTGDHAKATYTAPPAAVQGNQVFVVAYLVNDRTAGLGVAVIQLVS